MNEYIERSKAYQDACDPLLASIKKRLRTKIIPLGIAILLIGIGVFFLHPTGIWKIGLLSLQLVLTLVWAPYAIVGFKDLRKSGKILKEWNKMSDEWMEELDEKKKKYWGA